jgi:MFS family permease
MVSYTVFTPEKCGERLTRQDDPCRWSWLVSSFDPAGFTHGDSFADAYDLFAVNFVNILFGYVYYPDTGVLPSNIDVAIKMSSSVGTVMGQIGFGVLNDIYGRKKVVVLTYGIDRRCMGWN